MAGRGGKRPGSGGKRPGSGKPSTYSTAITDVICRRLGEGEMLQPICRDLGLAWTTVYDWRDAHEEFAEAYKKARQMGMDKIFEDALLIADTPLIGIERTEKADGGEDVTYKDMLGHRRLQIETRFKMLSKWNPARYGDKLETTHKGDAVSPITFIISPADAKL